MVTWLIESRFHWADNLPRLENPEQRFTPLKRAITFFAHLFLTGSSTFAATR